jgi:DNA-binding LacI/PurR family transcriptional regulator/GAF domain-containing protein
MTFEMNNESNSSKSRTRPTIGLLVHDITGVGGYESAVWNGVADAAQERDVDLICFPGGTLYSSLNENPDARRNAIYSLATADSVDGLIISSSLGNFLTPEQFQRFYDRYDPLPMVSIARTQEGIPSVLVDNYGGMRSAITHLIQEHGYRRIAFIRGPDGNEDAVQRYNAYIDTLTEYGLPRDPNLIAPGDFLPASGTEAVRLLLDEHKANFEAVVAADDNMALGAMEELQRRGIRVPYDIVVVGFDDIEEAWAATPALTSVQQPSYRLGKQATEMLLALLDGQEMPSQVIVPTRLITRQSCGCLSSTTAQAAANLITAARRRSETREPFETAFIPQRENILFEMVQTMGARSSSIVTERVEQVLDAFSTELRNAEHKDSSPVFLSALDEVLRQTAAEGSDVTHWQGAISALRRHALPYLADDETVFKAEDLWQQARVMIGENAQRLEAHRRLQAEQQAQTLRQVSQALITTFDMDELVDVVVQDLPRLGIECCSLSLYERRGVLSDKSKLVLAYDENGRIGPSIDEAVFSSHRLAPSRLLDRETRYTMIVEPLFFRDNQLGFALFKVGPRDGEIYNTLREHLSSTLTGAILVQEIEERTRALQEANYAIQRRAMHLEASAEVAQAITSIFDVDELFRKAVSLIRDQFGFYHAGIFLLDEAREWAILQEATGEAGARMKAQGHRLAVGETSMVGWTALHHKPRVALYAAEDAVRFANPLLPYTRSEMTLPMMIGGRPLGILNVQSTDEAAFDDDDVRTLQSMANQVAIAIENARQVSHEARLLETTSPVYRLSRQLAQVTRIDQVADSIITSVKEMEADGCTVVEFEFSPDGEPRALLYRGVWRRDREVQFRPGMRLPISESPFPFEMVSKLLIVADVEQDERLPQSARQVFIDTGIKALANIPLRARDKVIGQVVVLRTTSGPFSDAAVRLYEALSDQAAVALERAQLWEEAQRRAEREAQTRQTIDRIRRAVDIEQALQTTAEELSQAMKVPHISIELSLAER